MPDDPLSLVQAYLRHMERRELDTAQGFLADDAEIVFPGPFVARSTHDIAAYGGKRYRSIGKTYTATEAFPPSASGEGRVLMSGTLHGTTLQGTDFEGVRFIDVFTVRAGRIVRQEVWNDLAESGVLNT